MKVMDQGGAFAVDTPPLDCKIDNVADSLLSELASCLPSDVVISSDLFDLPLSWLCCRTGEYFFHPAPPRSRKRAFVAILLLMAGVERNPGPAQESKIRQLNVGVVNAQSIVNKAALIHDVIQDNSLDLLAITETATLPMFTRKKRHRVATLSSMLIANLALAVKRFEAVVSLSSIVRRFV